MTNTNHCKLDANLGENIAIEHPQSFKDSASKRAPKVCQIQNDPIVVESLDALEIDPNDHKRLGNSS